SNQNGNSGQGFNKDHLNNRFKNSLHRQHKGNAHPDTRGHQRSDFSSTKVRIRSTGCEGKLESADIHGNDHISKGTSPFRKYRGYSIGGRKQYKGKARQAPLRVREPST